MFKVKFAAAVESSSCKQPREADTPTIFFYDARMHKKVFDSTKKCGSAGFPHPAGLERISWVREPSGWKH